MSLGGGSVPDRDCHCGALGFGVPANWRLCSEAQPDLDPERLVFIDETGASTKLARFRGRAQRGQRCRAAVPHGHWKTTTFTGALRLGGMTAPMVLDGPMNRVAFQAYIDQVLVPTLRRGDIVVMDNLPAHKGSETRYAIEAAGAQLRYLPSTRRTSIRSRMPSQSSRPSCARRQREPSMISGTLFEMQSRCSRRRIVQDTSPQPDMSRIDRNLLCPRLRWINARPLDW